MPLFLYFSLPTRREKRASSPRDSSKTLEIAEMEVKVFKVYCTFPEPFDDAALTSLRRVKPTRPHQSGFLTVMFHRDPL